MSIKHALTFLAAIPHDGMLKTAVSMLGPDGELEGLALIACAHGYEVDAHSLQEAYRHHWMLRYLARHGSASPDTAALSAVSQPCNNAFAAGAENR